MPRLDGLEAFVQVVESGSFTAAAEALGVSKSAVSKQVRALEDRLGARLLDRTTRRLRLTDVGEAFHARSAAALEELAEAELAVTALHAEPRGTLRLSIPMSFGVRYLAPAIGTFLARHPQLSVDVDLSDRVVNLVDEGFDLAIRIGPLAEGPLVVRRLAPTRRHLCAAPAYLAAAGAPAHPDDLPGHQVLTYTYQAQQPMVLTGPDEATATVRPSGRLRANNGDVLREGALAAQGIALLPDFFVADDLATGRLVEVLPGWHEATSAIWAVYPHNRHLTAKVRLFVDLLAERLGPTPPWAA